jgi:hypothetical protein
MDLLEVHDTWGGRIIRGESETYGPRPGWLMMDTLGGAGPGPLTRWWRARAERASTRAAARVEADLAGERARQDESRARRIKSEFDSRPRLAGRPRPAGVISMDGVSFTPGPHDDLRLGLIPTVGTVALVDLRRMLTGRITMLVGQRTTAIESGHSALALRIGRRIVETDHILAAVDDELHRRAPTRPNPSGTSRR